MVTLKILSVTILIAVCYAKTNPKIVCYYNSNSHFREGHGKFLISDIESALPYCTHVIYGYAAVNDVSRKLIPLNENFDTVQDNYGHVTDLKKRYPNVKFLLSVGGNADVSGSGDEKNIKYRELIESSSLRLTFINSAYTMIKQYGFDGIDLAWEFPETKPKKIRNTIGKVWHTIKTKVAGVSVIDKKAEDHRAQFTALVRELKKSFGTDLLVTLSVLPNVNSTVYYDPRALSPHLDGVHLLAYDFYNPERNPEEADFSSPTHALIDRKFDENVDFQVNYWLNNGAASSKVVLGIATYGRTWKMTSSSDINGIPPLTVDGHGEAGPYTKDAGLLSYGEICQLVKNQNPYVEASAAPPGSSYKVVHDSSKRRGTYAYRLPDAQGKGGIWISYDDIETAANKANYAKSKSLGGVAVDDLSLDDFKGLCSPQRYPILHAVKTHL